MSRATTSELEQIETFIEYLRKEGCPDELLELYHHFEVCYDNARRLIGMFGVVDKGSADRAWELYTEFMEVYHASHKSHGPGSGRPTLH